MDDGGIRTFNIESGKTDWARVIELVLTSRFLDEIEEKELYPKGLVPLQFSAKGHELSQILLASLLNQDKDGVFGYYRCRPLLLGLGLEVADLCNAALASPNSYSSGRDVGVIANFNNSNGASMLPMSGGVGAQFSPAVGWAQALKLGGFSRFRGNEIAVAIGGDGSVASNGFWSAITIATTQDLPALFVIEDNGYGISVPSEFQTPGGDISKNLDSFEGLQIFRSDTVSAERLSEAIEAAVQYVRGKRSPGLLYIKVPRLSGHSIHDDQKYRNGENRDKSDIPDPLVNLQTVALSKCELLDMDKLSMSVREKVADSYQNSVSQLAKGTEPVTSFVYSGDQNETKSITNSEFESVDRSSSNRLSLGESIRETLSAEMGANDGVLIFGEDVAKKGGVHGVTAGLVDRFGDQRVFDTSLSEEGIIGRAVGLALAGMRPVAEIQFRKYAEPAAEQIYDCGTIRWRTGNRFESPVLIRIPVGISATGDPWHSQTKEAELIRSHGWKVAFPSNSEDATGLLRMALRSSDPVFFLEHRKLYNDRRARGIFSNVDHLVPFGSANCIKLGASLTIVTWGLMVHRCKEAARELDCEIIDLRTLKPWDRDQVLESVKKTGKCLIVHEDCEPLGFGAEICAVIGSECFFDLDAPVARLGSLDVPVPHNMTLMDQVIPSVDAIRTRIVELLEF